VKAAKRTVCSRPIRGRGAQTGASFRLPNYDEFPMGLRDTSRIIALLVVFGLALVFVLCAFVLTTQPT
jgi:hypothetical protein